MKTIILLILSAFTAFAATTYPVLTDNPLRTFSGGGTNLALLNGTNVFTAATNTFNTLTATNLLIQSTNPVFTMSDTDGTANRRIFRIKMEAGYAVLQQIADSGTAADLFTFGLDNLGPITSKVVHYFPAGIGSVGSSIGVASGYGLQFNANLTMVPWDGTRSKIRFGGSDGFQCQDSSSGDANLFQVTSGGIKIGSGSVVKNFLAATATLNFGNIVATASEDLTITVTGAAVNDAVTLGLPATVLSGAVFNAWVSASNTVTVRCNNAGSVAIDPASDTYRVTVISH